MTSIPTAICRVYSKHIKHYYIEKNDFFCLLIAFLKCAWNLEHFQKNDEYPSVIISEIIDAESIGYLHV